MMTDEITNTQDFIDSRDVIARVEELEAELEDGTIADDGKEELHALKTLSDECKNYTPNWADGATLIRDSYFKEYAQDFADDIGATSRDVPWPQGHINWDDAVEELLLDYACVDFDGVKYWVRSG